MDRETAKAFIEKHYGIGWLNLVDIVYDNVPDDEIEITEVFQKWGALKIRYTGKDEGFAEMLEHISYISQKMCEVCGKSARETIIGSWVNTLCQEHYEELSSKMK
ncbi:MAG: hypothetical protein MUC49_01385 [Raineya sp.]|jgi:hypothetical protein|nr:hypothetical protein [Raineya sp.]